MNGKWIILIIIVLGIIAIYLNGNNSSVPFGINSESLFGNGADETIRPGSGLAGGNIVELKKGKAGARDYHDEYLIVAADEDNASVVDITNWTLESPVTGVRVTIGQAALLARAKITKNILSNVVLAPGEEAVIATPISPLGDSFKTNKCIGYLQGRLRFRPRVSRECPLLEDEDLISFGIDFRDSKDKNDSLEKQLETGEACVDYIERVSRCEVAEKNSDLSDECNDFIKTYGNYEGCLLLHKNDPDFLGDEWRVYLRAGKNAWRDDREVIRLLNQSGGVVDVISY